MKVIKKTVLLKVYEPNEGKKKCLDRVIELYAKTLDFLP